MLERGVSGDGGAKNTYVAGYKIAAKTGTSEVRDLADPDGNYSYRVGSTVAYAPADDPQISAIIVVDTPMISSKYGAYVAAPYVANLLSEILPYIGIEPQYTEAEYAKLKTTVRNVTGWPTADAVIGNGDVVKYQVPAR